MANHPLQAAELEPFKHIRKLDFYVYHLTQAGYDCSKTTVHRWLAGTRAAPAGVSECLLRALTPDEQLQYLNARFGEYGFIVTDDDPIASEPSDIIRAAVAVTSLATNACLDGEVDSAERAVLTRAADALRAAVAGVQ